MFARSLLVTSLLACNPTPPDGGNPEVTPPLVTGLRIVEVSAYQTLKIPLLATDGSEPARALPLVRGRDTMIRVFLRPDAGWDGRKVRVELALSGSGGDLALRQELPVLNTSSDATLSTTFNFNVPGARLTGDAKLKITLREAAPNVNRPGDSSGAVWPVDGERELGAVDTGGPLKVVMIPVRYLADGSTRLPDTSSEQLQRYRNQLYALYPTPAVEMTVREPIDWDVEITAFGDGWEQLLERISSLREEDGAPDDVYYYGIFKPRTSLSQFCGGQGCILGLSALAFNPTDAWARSSIGLGYTGAESADTFVHEIGHAHGREHAPCGLGNQSSDDAFPYSDATIGVWGYDLGEKKLRSPSVYRDMMSYCSPAWVSDYTYQALFERIHAVNVPTRIQATPTRWRVVRVDRAGHPTAGRVVELALPPGGEARTVEVVEGGPAITGHFYPYSHLPGGLLLVPEATTHGLTLRFTGGHLPL